MTDDTPDPRPFVVRLATTINLTVRLSAEDEETAANEAWEHAEEYLRTLTGSDRGDVTVHVDATLDGIGADEVEEASA